MKLLTTATAATALALSSAAFATVDTDATATEAAAEGTADAAEMTPEEKRDAALVEGANVVTYDNEPLGTVNSVDGDNIVIGLEVGPVAFQRDWFMVNENGALAARMTSEQIDNLLAQAGAS